MRRVNAPPVVDENVEDTEENHKEARRPLGFEANRNHSASCKSKDRHKCARNRPFPVEHKPDEKEDQEYTAHELEATEKRDDQPFNHMVSDQQKHALHAAVILAEGRQTSKALLGALHCVAEYHDQASNDGQVA